MIDISIINNLNRLLADLRNYLYLIDEADRRIGSEGTPIWHCNNRELTIRELHELEQSALNEMGAVENELFTYCQDRHDKGLDLFPQLASTMIFAGQVIDTINGLEHFATYIDGNQERPSFIFPDVITATISGNLSRWKTMFAYYFPISQNGGHTEPLRGKDDKSNIFDVEGRKNALNGAKERALPDCIPGWFPKDAYFAKVDDKTILDGNLWMDTLGKLTLWLYDILRKGDFGEWDCISGVFKYRGRNGELKPATNYELTEAFKNLNRESKKK